MCLLADELGKMQKVWVMAHVRYSSGTLTLHVFFIDVPKQLLQHKGDAGQKACRGFLAECQNCSHHLPSCNSDCRAPLTEASLKPNVELKARIEQWKAEHMQGGG